MLSKYQHGLIDALPDEGGLYTLDQSGGQVAYSLEAAQEAAAIPLDCKVAAKNKRAIILHGAPGAGKSYSGMKRLESELEGDHDATKSTVVISYDEFGAMFDIQEYVVALSRIDPSVQGQHSKAAGDSFDQRFALWREFQPLSQYIRSKTLKSALAAEHSLYIDTTSSSAGTLKLIDLLRDLDYTDIEVWSYAAPFDKSADRVSSRPRPTSFDDLMLKRVGAYEMLPQLVRYADTVRVLMNESDTLKPKEIAHFAYGHYVSGLPENAESLLAMLESTSFRESRFAETATAVYGATKSTELQQRYAAAMQGFKDLLMPALLSCQPRSNPAYDYD